MVATSRRPSGPTPTGPACCPAAGEVTPSPKPYSPDGDPLNMIPESEWTPGMQLVAVYAAMIGRELLGCDVHVSIVREATWPYAATYGPGRLVFNVVPLWTWLL